MSGWIEIKQYEQQFKIQMSQVQYYSVSGEYIVFYFSKDDKLIFSDKAGKIYKAALKAS